jgi:hypothetical protein
MFVDLMTAVDEVDREETKQSSREMGVQEAIAAKPNKTQYCGSRAR